MEGVVYQYVEKGVEQRSHEVHTGDHLPSTPPTSTPTLHSPAHPHYTHQHTTPHSPAHPHYTHQHTTPHSPAHHTTLTSTPHYTHQHIPLHTHQHTHTADTVPDVGKGFVSPAVYRPYFGTDHSLWRNAYLIWIACLL